MQRFIFNLSFCSFWFSTNFPEVAICRADRYSGKFVVDFKVQHQIDIYLEIIRVKKKAIVWLIYEQKIGECFIWNFRQIEWRFFKGRIFTWNHFSSTIFSWNHFQYRFETDFNLLILKFSVKASVLVFSE